MKVLRVKLGYYIGQILTPNYQRNFELSNFVRLVVEAKLVFKKYGMVISRETFMILNFWPLKKKSIIIKNSLILEKYLWKYNSLEGPHWCMHETISSQLYKLEWSASGVAWLVVIL